MTLPFALDTGPLLRATLIRTAGEERTLLVSVHHVSADCWSMGMPFGPEDGSARAFMAGVFLRELWEGYHAPDGGRDAARPPPGRQFGDAARRQNAWLAGGEAARQLAFWRELLADRPRATEVPTDLPRPPVWDFRGERLRLGVDPGVTAALRALARAHGTTLFVVLQAAFGALLSRLTGEVDLVTGTTSSNRARWDADDLVGFFSNDLLIRTDLAGAGSFDEVVRRSHAATFASLSHQELPFERLTAALPAETAPDRHPLFQIRFLLHLPTDPPFEADGLSLRPVPIGREVAKYDLTPLLADDGESLAGWLEYATSLYRRETAAAMLERYRTLLAAVAARPDLPMSSI